MSIIWTGPNEVTFRKWFAKFHTGYMSPKDDEGNGRNYQNIYNIIFDDHRMKFIENTDTRRRKFHQQSSV